VIVQFMGEALIRHAAMISCGIYLHIFHPCFRINLHEKLLEDIFRPRGLYFLRGMHVCLERALWSVYVMSI
jgi:hypothetical protein